MYVCIQGNEYDIEHIKIMLLTQALDLRCSFERCVCNSNNVCDGNIQSREG